MISDELAKYTFNKDQIQIVNATEVIETEEPPVNAIRKKKDFFHRCGNESGKTKRGGCICIGR